MTQALRLERDGRRRQWDRRVRRARELRDRHPAAAAALGLYEEVLKFQADVAGDFTPAPHGEYSLREQIDIVYISSQVPSILTLAMEHGPSTLSQHARMLRDAGGVCWESMAEAAVTYAVAEMHPLDSFFFRACLQPVAESLQSRLPDLPGYSKNVCPACGGLPQLSVLRPEGEGASRFLLCSFCLREWLFRRILCPWCGEEGKEKLPFYTAEEFVHLRVEACDTCKRYLKAVDMTIDGRAEPLVDEASLAVLDVWAGEHGYSKIVGNLLGF